MSSLNGSAMNPEAQAPATMEQPRKPSRSAWGIAVGALFVLVFFFLLTGKLFLTPFFYWCSLLFVAIIFVVIWGRIYWRSAGRRCPPTWGEYWVGVVVLVAPFTFISAMSSMQVAHFLLPKEEKVLSFTVTGRGTYSSLKRKGCFYFSELPGVLKKPVCGYSRYFLAIVNVGDVFSYRAVVSPVGFKLKEVVEIKREGRLVYRRKGY